MSEADLLARIDDVTTPTCAQCGRPLAGSVSDDFCGPSCQQRWVAHQNDVQALTEYVEAMPNSVGWCDDHARWYPVLRVEHVLDSGEIDTWYPLVADVARWLDTARKQAETPVAPTLALTIPGPAWMGVDRTDKPMDDWLVAEIFAVRTPYECDARRLRAFADERARVGAKESRDQIAALGKMMGDSFAEMGRKLGEAARSMALAMERTFLRGRGADLVLVDDVPVEDPAARALRLRQSRNTGPQVHADPRRNRRR